MNMVKLYGTTLFANMAPSPTVRIIISYYSTTRLEREQILGLFELCPNQPKNRTFVGLPIGIKKITYTGKTSRKTLNQIAIMLEYGSRDGNLPPRPLWGPAYKAAGGKAALQKEIRNAVRNSRIKPKQVVQQKEEPYRDWETDRKSVV